MTLAVSRGISLVLAVAHLVVGLGIGWGIGPMDYDPATFMVQGKAGRGDPGLEVLFPRLLGCVYASVGMGIFFACYANTPEAIRSGLVVCLLYHFGAATDSMNLFREDSGALNPDKIDPNEPIYGHSLLFCLALASFVLAGNGGSASGIKKD